MSNYSDTTQNDTHYITSTLRTVDTTTAVEVNLQQL